MSSDAPHDAGPVTAAQGTGAGTDAHAARPDRERTQSCYASLPGRIDPADYVQSVDVTHAPDPNFGRDPDTEWMLKHA